MKWDKEELKKRRKEIYQLAKKRRDNDPRYMAYRDQQKEYRQAHCRKIKETLKAEKAQARLAERAAKDQALMALLKKASSSISV